ncbi:hypothetical protein AAEP93_003844 [Penicillium crustosum]
MALARTMRALLFSGIPFERSVGDMSVPTIQESTDAIVRVTASALCGSDFHIYRGTRVPQAPSDPIVVGHEVMGMISEISSGVNFLSVGNSVVIPDRIDDGHLLPEPETYTTYGSAQLGVAKYVRVPFANNGLIPAIFGAGPVGLLSAYSTILRGASSVYSVDSVPARLSLAASIGAVPIAFNESDPVQQILAMSLEVGNAVWTVLDMKQSMRLCRRKVISFCAI